MQQLTEDLWQSQRYDAEGLSSHAYLLTRPEGNVLFYNTGFDADLDQIEALGGIRHNLLTHRDEAGPSLARIKARFGNTLGCSEREVPFIERYAPVDLRFGWGDQQLDGIQVIHSPGHTEGSVCFFYASPTGQRYLFSGDTLFLWDGRWSTLVMNSAGGSKATLTYSLWKLRELQPDLVLSSGFVGAQAFAETTPASWQTIVDGCLAELRA